MRLALTGTTHRLALHGVQGRFGWGECRAFAAAARDEVAAYEPDVVLELLEPGDTAHGAWGSDRSKRAVWRADPGNAHPGLPTVAPGGRGLWRTAPLPAADRLFTLRGRRGQGVLVVGEDAAERAGAVQRLIDRRVPARAPDAPGLEDLAAAAVVAVVGTPGTPLPAVAFAVLAAGRLLLAPRAHPAFGLAPGVDHLAHGSADELAQAAGSACAFPEAFALVAAMGGLAADAQRASLVYGRVAADLAAS